MFLSQEELRRVEEVRRQGEERIKEDYRRIEEMRKVEDERRALEAARLTEFQEQASKLQALEAAIGLASEAERGLGQGLAKGLGSTGVQVERLGAYEAGLERGLGSGGLEEAPGVLGPDVADVPEKYECVVAHPGALCELLDTTRSPPQLTALQCSRSFFI